MMNNKFYQFFKDGNSASIKIYGDIVDDVLYSNEVSAISFTEELENLGTVDNINVYINSYGGSVSAGLAIYNQLKNHSAKVTTYCDGFACSIASVIFMAGDDRVMNEGSILMIHEPWCYTMGNADELQKQIESLRKLSQLSVDIYSNTTGIENNKIAEMMKAETWITPKEALELGFATTINGSNESSLITQSVKESLIKMIMKANKENNEVLKMEEKNIIENQQDEIVEETIEEVNEVEVMEVVEEPQIIIEESEATQMKLEENKNIEMESVNYMLDRNREIMEERGQRKLTTAEEKFYARFVEAAKSRNPQQAFIELEGNEETAMPETIIEDVFKDMVEQHELLGKVNGVYAGYATKWILNDHSKQTAAWGKINGKITKEIEGAFKVVDIKQCKLSAFAQIPVDMLDLGKSFLDAYIRKALADAIAVALEQAIVSGSGIDMPCGLMYDRAEDTGLCTLKSVKAVTELSPKVFGEIVAEMSVTPNGHSRKIDKVQLIVNNKTYLTKILPAVQVLGVDGIYRQELPFPTEIVISAEVADDRAIVAKLDEYFLGLAVGKEGVIEFSNEYKFLEDERTYKVKLHACGMPMDNNIARVLDVSGLGEKVIKVKHEE